MTDIDKHWIRNSFDHAVDNYDSAAVLQREVADRLENRLQYIVADPKVILDIGSGTGYSAAKIRQRYPKAKVIELDISPSMLKLSKKKQSWFARMRRQHQYICADAEALPLANDSVDMVFSSLAIQWCQNHNKLFNNIARVLKPGGLLMFATLGPDTLRELRKSWSTVDDHPHVVTFDDMHDVGDEMVRAQFENPVLDMETITLTYSQVRDLMRDLKQLGSRNAMNGRNRGLTGKKRMQEMIQAYEKYRRNDVIPATYEIVYGHAWSPARKFDTASSEFPIPIKIMN